MAEPCHVCLRSVLSSLFITMDVNVDPTYPLFSVFAFCTFFLVLIPLPLHVQAWNVGTCAYITWVAVACLLEFINSVVWRNNVLNLAPVWCDICMSTQSFTLLFLMPRQLQRYFLVPGWAFLPPAFASADGCMSFLPSEWPSRPMRTYVLSPFLTAHSNRFCRDVELSFSTRALLLGSQFLSWHCVGPSIVSRIHIC